MSSKWFGPPVGRRIPAIVATLATKGWASTSGQNSAVGAGRPRFPRSGRRPGWSSAWPCRSGSRRTGRRYPPAPRRWRRAGQGRTRGAGRHRARAGSTGHGHGPARPVGRHPARRISPDVVFAASTNSSGRLSPTGDPGPRGWARSRGSAARRAQPGRPGQPVSRAAEGRSATYRRRTTAPRRHPRAAGPGTHPGMTLQLVIPVTLGYSNNNYELAEVTAAVVRDCEAVGAGQAVTG